MKALLLMAFGGPRSLDEVEFMLTRLFKGRKPSSDELERVRERYRLIGGFSPLPEITRSQARALEERLNARGHDVKSYVGMRYSHPLIEETLKQIVRDGIREVLAIPMSPFRSRAGTGAYVEELNRVREGLGVSLQISLMEGWHTHPLFLEAVRERIREGLKGFSPEEREKVHIIFTAHSLPISIIRDDPYLKDMEASVRGVLDGFECSNWQMAFQSKGRGPEEWAGPDVESVLKELSAKGINGVLIVPIGFLCDHIEILYDIDILYRKKAESMGMTLRRSPSINLSERFLDALASVVEEQMKG